MSVDPTARRRPTLAVFGGSFNPPHVAHAMMPSYLFARGLAEHVLVAPCWSHALGKELAPFWRRVGYCDAAFAQYGERVTVSPIEAELAEANGGAPSYALHLLAALRDRYPGYRLRLVVGSDITQSGETQRWHRWDRIESDFEPIVVPRAGFAPVDAAALPGTSSSQVRAWLAQRGANAESLALAVPPEVLRLVTEPSAGRVCVVGSGNAAQHVVRWLARASPHFEVHRVEARALLGEPVALCPARVGELRGVWLLGRDGQLGARASALVEGGLARGTPVLHGAGALVAREVLRPLHEASYPVGTLHPICSLRKECGRSRLGSAGWGIEGAPQARALARQIVSTSPVLDLEGLDAAARVRYHAACALLANHVAVLHASARTQLCRLDVGDEASVSAAVDALLRSAVDNLLALGVPLGVSGPAARGEMDVVQAHAQALGGEAGELYALLSRRLAALLA